MVFLSARPSWQRTCTEIGIKDSGEVKPFLFTRTCLGYIHKQVHESCSLLYSDFKFVPLRTSLFITALESSHACDRMKCLLSLHHYSLFRIFCKAVSSFTEELLGETCRLLNVS